MPEKFTFSMPIKAPPSMRLRQSLLQELPRRMPQWLHSPVEVLFLDPTSAAPSPQVSWPDAQARLGRPLAERTMAFVYFNTERKDGGRSIVELSESARATSYSVTLPDASYNLEPSAIPDAMIAMHRWLESNQRDTFIVGGNELAVGPDWAAWESDIGRALEEPLVEWLCCATSRMSLHLDEFEIVREVDGAVICRRGVSAKESAPQ